MKIKLTIEYDGRGFHGWQSQSNLKTIQKHVEDSIIVFLRSLIKKNPAYHLHDKEVKISLTGSGRTDAGVSARGQVASFIWPDLLEFSSPVFIKSLNGITNHSVSILDAETVDDNFDARKSAVSKMYSYCISFRGAPHALDRDRILHVPGCNVSHEILKEICSCFAGMYDFSCYRSSDCSSVHSVRNIFEINVNRTNEEIYMITFHGNGFLKHMIRFIMGDIVRCCKKQLTIEDIKGMLSGKVRKMAPWCVSPFPLTLEKVYYGK
jgi:tRNA pseudouridine38-40 synthase